MEEWEVRNDGTVRVPEAGIMFSSGAQPNHLKDLGAFSSSLSEDAEEENRVVRMGAESMRLSDFVSSRRYVCSAVWLLHEDQEARGSQRNVFGLLSVRLEVDPILR